MLTVNKDPR